MAPGGAWPVDIVRWGRPSVAVGWTLPAASPGGVMKEVASIMLGSSRNAVKLSFFFSSRCKLGYILLESRAVRPAKTEHKGVMIVQKTCLLLSLATRVEVVQSDTTNTTLDPCVLATDRTNKPTAGNNLPTVQNASSS